MAIVGPIAPYSNVPIQPQNYQPRRYNISAITLGQTTTITTSEDHDYVVGQQVRLVIPSLYGTIQLNGKQGFVISVPADDQVVVDIDSSFDTTFIPTPYTATITNITQASNAVVTANNYFRAGDSVQFSDVSGMTEINDMVGSIISSNSTSFTVNINSLSFTGYGSGGVATLYNVPQNQAQILAIGDISSGQINSSGRVNNIVYIPGSFINISPN